MLVDPVGSAALALLRSSARTGSAFRTSGSLGAAEAGGGAGVEAAAIAGVDMLTGGAGTAASGVETGGGAGVEATTLRSCGG